MDAVFVTPALPPSRIPAVALPVEACMYCWYVLYPAQAYPEAWSSTCCTGHDTWIKTQQAARRAQRLAQQQQKLEG
jgi:hypothetical protein